MISFEPLLRLLKDRNISLYHFKRDKLIGTSTIDSIRTGNKGVTTDSINAICRYLNCQPGDIMEYVPDKE